MSLTANPRLRAAAKRVPGLQKSWYLVRRRLIMLRGVAQLDYPRTPIEIRSTTEEIVNLRLRPTEKEPWTVAWIERNVRAGDVFWDIGANVGVYSLIAAKVSRGSARTIAVEPGYANYADLCENVLRNEVGDSVLPLPIVLAESTRLGSLNYRDVAAGAAIHTLDGSDPGVYPQPVLVYALDELIELFGLPAPTLIKLDVDGAEAAVLAGARKTLSRPELRSLIVEIEDAQSDAVLAEIEGPGFRVVDRFDERAGQPLPGVWYGIFERP